MQPVNSEYLHEKNQLTDWWNFALAQMGTWIWARPDLYFQRQPVKPAEQCIGNTFLYVTTGIR